MESKNVKAKEIIREVLSQLSVPIPMEKIKDDELLQLEYGVDSILQMEYMVLLEERLNIQFDEEFTLDTLDSIAKTAEYISLKYGDLL